MKKIPTLFIREFENHCVKSITDQITPGMEWVLNGDGIATEKFDGACCAIIDGEFYKRYDAKKDKRGNYKLPPEGAIPCCDPDPITGHWPHWVKVDHNNPSDKWFIKAYNNSYDATTKNLDDWTYEAIGPHFRSNPYNLNADLIVKHGKSIIDLPVRSFDSIRKYLKENLIEGIVFWKDDQPMCKIKRSDFGFAWPGEE